MTVVSAWGAPEWQASLMMLPLSLAIALFSGRAGRLADRKGPRLLLTVGALLVGLSYAGLAATASLMMMWQVWFPILFLQAAGMAMLVSPLSAAVMLATPDADTGLASGVNNAVARAAGLMAVAGLGAVASLAFSGIAEGRLPGVEFGARLEIPLDAAAQALRLEATNAAFGAVAAIAAAACLLAAVIAWTTQPAWDAATPPTPRDG